MDNKHYLLSQKPLLASILAKIDRLEEILAAPQGTAEDFDFAFADLCGHLANITEFSISTPGFTGLTDLSLGSLMGNLCDRTAKAMRAPFAYLGFGGSSHFLLMIIGKILRSWINDETASIVLVDPLCHQSVLGGLDIGRWQAVKLGREYYGELGVAAPMALQTVKAAVKKHGSHKTAALVYNPVSYDGFRNIKAEREIFAYCKAKNIKVICDFSWSPFFGFPGYGDVSGSLIDHADISICSPHKKNLFPSSASMLLYRDRSLSMELIEAGRLGWATTSPSFGAMMLVDYRLALIETGIVSEQLSEIVSVSKQLRKEFAPTRKRLSLVDPSEVGADYCEPGHLLFSARGSGIDCRELSQWLSQHAYIDLEKATKQTALYLVAASHQPHIDRIKTSLSEAISTLENNGVLS